MKKCRHALSAAAALVIAGLAPLPAQASEILNLPYSAGSPTAACFAITAFGFSGGTTPNTCYVDFPLTVPTGHTVKQITVLHGTVSFLPYPAIEAYLAIQPFASPEGTINEFDWVSSNYFADGTLQKDQIMAQWGKSFPDQFVMQIDNLYHVVVKLDQAAWVAGLQVTYE